MVRHVRVRGQLVTTLVKMAELEERSIQFICERLLREAIQARALSTRAPAIAESDGPHVG